MLPGCARPGTPVSGRESGRLPAKVPAWAWEPGGEARGCGWSHPRPGPPGRGPSCTVGAKAGSWGSHSCPTSAGPMPSGWARLSQASNPGARQTDGQTDGSPHVGSERGSRWWRTWTEVSPHPPMLPLPSPPLPMLNKEGPGTVLGWVGGGDQEASGQVRPGPESHGGGPEPQGALAPQDCLEFGQRTSQGSKHLISAPARPLTRLGAVRPPTRAVATRHLGPAQVPPLMPPQAGAMGTRGPD